MSRAARGRCRTSRALGSRRRSRRPEAGTRMDRSRRTGPRVRGASDASGDSRRRKGSVVVRIGKAGDEWSCQHGAAIARTGGTGNRTACHASPLPEVARSSEAPPDSTSFGSGGGRCGGGMRPGLGGVGKPMPSVAGGAVSGFSSPSIVMPHARLLGTTRKWPGGDTAVDGSALCRAALSSQQRKWFLVTGILCQPATTNRLVRRRRASPGTAPRGAPIELRRRPADRCRAHRGPS